MRVSNIAYKDYDPGTGNKILNNYMILREIGRGMHGKVKLAQDLDTGELVVYIQNHIGYTFNNNHRTLRQLKWLTNSQGKDS